MQAYFLLAVCLTLVFGIASAAMLRRKSSEVSGPADWEWAKEFSAAKYRPMERLLLGDDEIFLRAQRGFDPAMTKALRKDRRRVFRSFLKSLRNDFNRLYDCAKQSVLYSATDESELVHVLMRQRVLFYWAVCRVELRLALHATGDGRMDVRPLMEALEGLQSAVRLLEPAPSAAA